MLTLIQINVMMRSLYKSFRMKVAASNSPWNPIATAPAGVALGKRIPFLIVYYGSDGAGSWQSIDRPLRTVTTLDRFGLVTWEGREPMLRMLQVEELRSAMGFPNSHLFEHGTRRDKIRMLGNGVVPPVMQAIVETLANT